MECEYLATRSSTAFCNCICVCLCMHCMCCLCLSVHALVEERASRCRGETPEGCLDALPCWPPVLMGLCWHVTPKLTSAHCELLRTSNRLAEAGPWWGRAVHCCHFALGLFMIVLVVANSHEWVCIHLWGCGTCTCTWTWLRFCLFRISLVLFVCVLS